ncbi:MAG TPA: serine hydrolase domain-containing protein, partial [Roseiflexaceae bacterium]|nr:serine hydrolase domain-containing protein [Roseiflexaceae bacterium]
GALDLHAPAAAYLPELRARDVLVRHLLTHTSGLDLRLSPLARAGREALLRAVYAASQKHPPGAAVAYTNINSLLLGEIVARLYGAPLDTAIHALVAAPLGLEDTRFRPPAGLRARIAPTELDEEWRGNLVHGAVHDESAHALGGVAGHAGLFSTAADLWRFCRAWLPPVEHSTLNVERPATPHGTGDVQPSTFNVPTCNILRPETIALATRNHTPGLSHACGLGWMLDRPSFMGAVPEGTFGHTGFTGPAIVVAPGRALVVVVLSNRVFPRRGPPAHHAVTAAIVQAALEHNAER